jgi:putative copper export protein
VFLPLQIVTGVLLAWNKGVTMSSLTEPGYGRTLAAKLVAFALVMIAAGAHSWARNTDRALLARALAIGSLIGSLVIVLLATALPSS